MKSGLLLVDKPVGVTSTHVCQLVKKIVKGCQKTKVGHTGTLDPFASGLLIIALNKATKSIPYIVPCTKSYQFTIQLGVSTDTFDCTGTVQENIETAEISLDKLKEALLTFVPGYEQTPPIFSAVKHLGKRLYDYARDNEIVDIAYKKKWVDILSLDLIDYKHPYLELKMTCGHGTYVRSLAVDFASRFSYPASVVSLRRIENGGFLVENALEYSQINLNSIEEHIIDLNDVLKAYDMLELKLEDIPKIKHGQTVDILVSEHRELDKMAIFRINNPENEVEGLAKIVSHRTGFVTVQPILNF